MWTKMRKKFRVASGADLLAARKRQALKPGKVLSGKEAFGIMEHVVLGDEVEDKSDSSLQELANAALKSLSEFQIKPRGMIKSISTELLLKYSAQPLHVRGRAEQWELQREEMKFGSKIGEGDGGVIYRAEWRGLEVVAKMLRTEDEEMESNISMEVARQDLVNEISVLSRLRHPNLVMFLGACTIGEPLVILSEYMPGGNLEDLLVKRMADNKGVPNPPPNKMVLRWSIELARALCFLHNCSPPIIHRDLKPTNLLVDESGHLKVGDFGLCKVKQLAIVSGTYSMTGNTGSYRYMAPEVFENTPSYDEKVDIYSSAMIMWYIAMDQRPFDRVPADLVARQACKTGLRPSLDGIISTGSSGREFAKLIAQCWDADPTQRPSAMQLVDSLDAWGGTCVNKKGRDKSCTIS